MVKLLHSLQYEAEYYNNIKGVKCTNGCPIWPNYYYRSVFTNELNFSCYWNGESSSINAYFYFGCHSRLLLRICQALKSRAFEVRETARGTLSKITNSLGIYYFPFVLNELQTSLLRGYQVNNLLLPNLYFFVLFESNHF